MTECEKLAEFALETQWDDISDRAKRELKIRILDSVGCAIGALDGTPVQIARQQIDEFGGQGVCTLIGGGRTSPDRVAFFNGALIRYLDFMDNFTAPDETCHPSDNVAAILAATEYSSGTGKDLLAALAAAYQIQCRLLEVAPITHQGFDHTTQLAYSIAAGICRALKMPKDKAANAIALCGSGFNTLWGIRTGKLSHWKGMASASTAFGCVHHAFLAMRGITGPHEIVEGTSGFQETIAGKFEIDWKRENREKVLETHIKKFNAEVHAQSVLEAILEMREKYSLQHADIQWVDISAFETTANIIGGGGESGDKTDVTNKEQADHSLPYLAAVAILDGEVMPEQFTPERIMRRDVQELLNRVTVRQKDKYTDQYPEKFGCRVTMHLRDGSQPSLEKWDYEGFRTRPLSWERVAEKFDRLSALYADLELRNEIKAAIQNLDSIPVSDLTRLLASAGQSTRRIKHRKAA